jgi:hypothetical protein
MHKGTLRYITINIGQRDNFIITRRLNVEYLQDSMLNEQGSNVGVGQAQCKVSGSKLQNLGIILQNLICIFKKI